MSEKPKRISPKERAKLIEEAIRLVYASLESHLEFTHDQSNEGKPRPEFHVKATNEYARVIEILTRLY